jgi:putative transposase
MQFDRRNLPHFQKDFAPHFVTFVTKSRSRLPAWARSVALSCCRHDHGKKYELLVAVVMPDHVHLILTPLVNESKREIFSLIETMRGIKGASPHEINRRMGTHGPVWQEESFDPGVFIAPQRSRVGGWAGLGGPEGSPLHNP